MMFAVAPPRVLTIDDDRVFRRLLRQHVSVRWPEATVAEHDPIELATAA